MEIKRHLAALELYVEETIFNLDPWNRDLYLTSVPRVISQSRYHIQRKVGIWIYSL